MSWYIVGRQSSNAQVEAVGKGPSGVNHISASLSKPRGGTLSAPVKKLNTWPSEVFGISPSVKWDTELNYLIESMQYHTAYNIISHTLDYLHIHEADPRTTCMWLLP